jgi:hypothetical protein
MSDCVCQGIEHQEWGEVRRASQFELSGTSTGSNQNAGTHTRILGCLQISDRITHKDGVPQVQLIAFSSLQDESRGWFSAGAGVLRGVGAQKRVVYSPASHSDSLQNKFVNIQGLLQGENTPANSGLVCNQDYFERRVPQLLQCSQPLRQEDYFFQAANVIGLVFDDHTITVKE